MKRALDQIDAVREAVRTHPQDLMLATTAADVRKAAADHKIAALMGMEGGHMIDDDLRLLRVYAALGVRYMTLTHYKNNNWADSSTDTVAHNGLTAFGKAARKPLILKRPAVSERSESNGEMFEWLKEHAWKTNPATFTDGHQNTSSRNQFNDLPL